MKRHKIRAGATSGRYSGAVAVLMAGTTIGLAACGGASTPGVASLPASTSTPDSTTATGAPHSTTATGAPHSTTATGASRSTTALGKRNPTRLVDEWATCMHSHGDPNQADPTIDAYGVINVTIPSSAAPSLSAEVHAGADPCDRYMAAAQSALRAANPVAPPPDQAEQLKYVNCMRANGVPQYPYPQGNRTDFNGTGVDPNSPAVMKVNELCGRKLNLPAWWISGNGRPGEVSVREVVSNGAIPPGAGG